MSSPRWGGGCSEGREGRSSYLAGKEDQGLRWWVYLTRGGTKTKEECWCQKGLECQSLGCVHRAL